MDPVRSTITVNKSRCPEGNNITMARYSLDERHSKVSTHLHSTTNQKKDMLVFTSNGLGNCREQATVLFRYVLISIFYL
jgi:hypothetical protein